MTVIRCEGERSRQRFGRVVRAARYLSLACAGNAALHNHARGLRDFDGVDLIPGRYSWNILIRKSWKETLEAREPGVLETVRRPSRTFTVPVQVIQREAEEVQPRRARVPSREMA
jgi:hypothetical protein